jgi:hypothetical protein
MYKWFRNILVLVSPFLLMVLVNETARYKQKEKGFLFKGNVTMNSAVQKQDKCSWYCHNNTNYCKVHHVKLLQSYFNFTDPIYFGMIKFLKSTGNYQTANIFIMMIIWPLLMFILFVKSINLYSKIKSIKKEQSV